MELEFGFRERVFILDEGTVGDYTCIRLWGFLI